MPTLLGLALRQSWQAEVSTQRKIPQAANNRSPQSPTEFSTDHILQCDFQLFPQTSIILEGEIEILASGKGLDDSVCRLLPVFHPVTCLPETVRGQLKDRHCRFARLVQLANNYKKYTVSSLGPSYCTLCFVPLERRYPGCQRGVLFGEWPLPIHAVTPTSSAYGWQ